MKEVLKKVRFFYSILRIVVLFGLPPYAEVTVWWLSHLVNTVLAKYLKYHCNKVMLVTCVVVNSINVLRMSRFLNLPIKIKTDIFKVPEIPKKKFEVPAVKKKEEKPAPEPAKGTNLLCLRLKWPLFSNTDL